MRTVLDVVGVCLLAAVLLIIIFAFRRRWLSRDGGTFDCSLQLAEKDHGRGQENHPLCHKCALTIADRRRVPFLDSPFEFYSAVRIRLRQDSLRTEMKLVYVPLWPIAD